MMNVKKKEHKKGNAGTYLALHGLLVLVSLSAVCSKFASREEFLSLRYCIFQCGMIGFLGIYAIGWQQIIKHMDLTAAYVNKAVTVLWGFVWSVLLFQEKLSSGRLIGGLLVMAGVVLFAFSDTEARNGAGGETDHEQ